MNIGALTAPWDVGALLVGTAIMRDAVAEIASAEWPKRMLLPPQNRASVLVPDLLLNHKEGLHVWVS